jgi:hypothetical protein
MVRLHMMDVIVPFVLLGCASSGAHPRGSYDANLITEDEIVASHSTTAYEAIHKLRANFLSQRGLTSFYNTSSPMPTVYLDGQRFGEISILQTIPAEVVATIRLFRAWEATTRYGTNNMGGVIAITTRQGFDQSAAYRNRQ